MPSKKNIVIITLIIASAIFFRFWQFDSIPTGLYQDEAMNGADALTFLRSGDFKAFYQNNNGREGLIVWLDALAIKMFGTEPWVLRLFPALAGTLAVLGLYFLTKELLGAKIALISSFLMATSFWAVHFSRIGFRANLMLPLLIWSFYFLLRAFKNYRHRMSIIWFILAGIVFGLGFYTYISFRFAPILVLAVFAPFLIKNRKNKKLWIGILAFIASVFIIALPIGLYFLQNPADFFGRSAGVSIFSQDHPLKAFGISVVQALVMFNIVGDFNWRHNYAGAPQLFLPVGILFILGLALAVRRFNFEDRFFIFWLGIFLLPNILTAESNPHALRALGAMPAAMVLSATGLFWIYEKTQRYFAKTIENPNYAEFQKQLMRLKKESFLIVVVFLLFIAGYNFNLYFNRWASNTNVASAFSYDQVKIAQYLNKAPAEIKKYVIWDKDDRATDNGLPVSVQTVYFLTSQKTKIIYLKSDEIDSVDVGSGAVIAPIFFKLDFLHNLNGRFFGSKINIIDINTAVVEIQ